MSDVVRILDGNTFVVSDRQGDIEASLDRPDRSLLVRHALHLEVGAHDRRPAAERAVGRRSALLGDALLPRAGDGHGVHRLEGVGDPAAHRRRRISRGDHDPQPRREAGRPTVRIDAGSDFADLFEVKDALAKKGSYSRRVERGRLVLGYERETFRRETIDRGDDAGQARRDRPHLQASDRVARRVDHRRRRRPPWRCSRAGERGAAAEARRRSTCRRASSAGSRGAPARVRLGRVEGDVPAVPHRSRGAALLAAGGRRQEPARGRPAVVHDDVRPRQHLHEPAGAAVHAGAGSRDPARARRSGRARARTTSATRIPAGSCTRCATAR